MFTDPVKNLRAFGIGEDSIVADLGAGSGFYTIPAAQMARSGKVYAVEILKDFITTLRTKAKDAHVSNIECLWGNIEKVGGTKIKDHIIDRVIASNVLFQVEDKGKFIEEAKRILKPGGRLLLIDWSDGTSALAPRGDMVIPKYKAREMFENSGFAFEKDVESTGEHHYGMIFKRT